MWPAVDWADTSPIEVISSGGPTSFVPGDASVALSAAPSSWGFSSAPATGGAFAMGAGIWSMHFVAMLAFSLPIPTVYDVVVTLISMLIAVVVSGFALFTVTRNTLSRRNLIVTLGTT